MEIDLELHPSFGTEDSAFLSGDDEQTMQLLSQPSHAPFANRHGKREKRKMYWQYHETGSAHDHPSARLKKQYSKRCGRALLASIILLLMSWTLFGVYSVWYATEASKASAMRNSPKGAFGVNTTGGPTLNTTVSFPSGLTDLTGPRSAITVGLRHNAPVQQRCTATEFTQALENVVLPENALSRHVNYFVPSLDESQTLPPFAFSWKLPSCDQPRIYTREEACDILASFRGVYFAGDSLVRHLWDAILLLLTNDIGGAIFTNKEEVREQCRGERLFRDRRPNGHTTKCRSAYYKNIDLMKVCPGRKVSAKYHDHNDGFNLNDFKKWSKNLPAPSLSIVFLSSAGIHQMYNFNRVRENWLRHVLALRSRPDSTAPILLWQGNHCPGANIAKKYSETQGPEVVKKYNAKVKAHIAEQGMDYLEGGMNFIAWFNATQGAQSYDGQHYSYQVNMEKAQTFLNILDLTWRDAARRGGLATEKMTSS